MLRVKQEKKYECRRRGADSKWGVQKIKKKTKLGFGVRRRALGLGRAQTGSGQEGIYKGERPIFIHFSLFFLSLLFPSSPSSLSSLTCFSLSLFFFSDGEGKGGGRIPTRWPASYRGGAAASELKLIFFKIFFCFIFFYSYF